MGVIATIEDQIMAKTAAALTLQNKSLVKTIGTIPGPWSVDILRRMLQRAPAVYVAFINGDARAVDGDAVINARFDVAAVTEHHGTEADRRRGDKTQIGAYEILERAVPHLNNLVIDGAGTLRLDRIINLFNEATFTIGATVYVAQLTMPNLVLPVIETGSDLDDFETFHADFDIPPFDKASHGDWLGEDYDDAQPDAQEQVAGLDQL